MCDLDDNFDPLIPIPATLKIEQLTTAEMKTLTGDTTLNSKYGYVTYRNNGTGVTDFNLYLTVEVTYGWGVIVKEGIKVPVKGTIAKD